MLILAFDTSGMAGSVALLDGPQLLGERTLDSARRSAQTLAPAIVELLAERKVEASDIRLVATTMGPGSFTGLRVGVTTAKTFAYAVGAEAIGLSTLEVIAQQTPGELRGASEVEIQAVLGAQRKELFVGRFRREPAGMARLEADRIVPIEAWAGSLPANAIVTGNGLTQLGDRRLPSGVVICPKESWEPRGATVGQLAWRYYGAGRRDDLWKLAPVYLRPSYAEEKLSK